MLFLVPNQPIQFNGNWYQLDALTDELPTIRVY